MLGERRRWFREVSAALAVAGVAGCERGAPPRAVTLEVAEVVISEDPVAVVVHVRDATGRRAASSGEHDFSLTPAGVAEVSPKGMLRCLRSGDATVGVDIQGVSASAPVRCRPVSRLEAADVGRVEIADGPFAPEVAVLDGNAKVLDDVPLQLSSKTPGVLQVEQARLAPKSVGRATVVARVGALKEDFTVDVVRRLRPEALPIDADRRIHFSLEPGRYELRVELPESKRLSMEWRGAPYCNYDAEEKVHQATCVLRTKGGVVFDNPAWLLRGETTVSHDGIELREVP
jgi:hypothetical protein